MFHSQRFVEKVALDGGTSAVPQVAEGDDSVLDGRKLENRVLHLFRLGYFSGIYNCAVLEELVYVQRMLNNA